MNISPRGIGGPTSILALTMGEPAGVGGELTLKAWHRRKELPLPFVALDNAERLIQLAGKLGIPTPIKRVGSPMQAVEVFHSSLPVLDIPLAEPCVAGQLTSANAVSVINSSDLAVSHALAGRVSGVVTIPINKHALYESGFSYPGHTEYLAKLSGSDVEPVMMLACDGLRTVPVTTHLSLRNALDALTADLIISQTRITTDALAQDFGLRAPRIAIAGLNPHAGEDGTMGDEEKLVIEPAITKLKEMGLNVAGPYPPDTLFSAALRPSYDAAICMYHDQALIPIKTLDFSGGVNITLGLPFVRTSPDHGTALDIAGKGIADETSLINASRVAAEIAHHRNAPHQAATG